MSGEDVARCSQKIYGGFWSYNTGGAPLCSRKGVLKEGGKIWCRQHAPSTRRKKDAERKRASDRRHAEFLATMRESDAEEALIDAVLKAATKDIETQAQLPEAVLDAAARLIKARGALKKFEQPEDEP